MSVSLESPKVQLSEIIMHTYRAASAALRTVYKKYQHGTHSKVALLPAPRSLLEA